MPHLGGAVLGLKKDLDIYSRSSKYLKSSCFSLELRVRDRPKQVIMGILYLPECQRNFALKPESESLIGLAYCDLEKNLEISRSTVNF